MDASQIDLADATSFVATDAISSAMIASASSTRLSSDVPFHPASVHHHHHGSHNNTNNRSAAMVRQEWSTWLNKYMWRSTTPPAGVTSLSERHLRTHPSLPPTSAVTSHTQYDLHKQSTASPNFQQRPVTLWNLLRAFARRFFRGFMVAYSLKSFLGLLGFLLRQRKSLVALVRSPSFKRIQALWPQLRAVFTGEPVRYGAFLGMFIAAFQVFLKLSRHVRLFEVSLEQARENFLAIPWKTSSSSSPASRRIDSNTQLQLMSQGTVDQITSSTNLLCPPDQFSWLTSKHRCILLSGGLAGLLSYPFIPSDSRASFALFLALRSCEALARFIGDTYHLPSWTQHADVFVFSLATGHLIWAASIQRDSIDPGYLSFLQKHCGKPRPIMHVWAGVQGASMPKGLDPFPHTWADYQSQILKARWSQPIAPLDFALARNDLCCAILHPHTDSCIEALLVFFRESFERSLRLYAPMYCVTTVLFKLKKLLAKPWKIIKTTVQALVRSTLFLSSYCTFGWGMCCLMRQGFNLPNVDCEGYAGALTCVAGIVSGFCFLIEARSRRIELALYVTSHALWSFWAIWGPQGYKLLPRIPGFAPMLFAASSAGFLLAFVEKNQMIRAHYFSTLKFLFGECFAELSM